MANRNLDDLTIAYLLKKVTASVNSAWQAAVSTINNTIASIQSSMVSTSDYPITVAHGGTGQTETSGTTTITSIATPGANFTITSASYKQWGKVAQIILAMKCTTSVTGTTEKIIATIVSGKRPALATTVIDSNGSYDLILTDGTVKIYRAVSADAAFAVRAVYLLP